MVDSNFLRRHDKSLVVHLLEPAMKRCLNINIDKQLKNICKFGIHKRTERKNFSPKNQTLRSPLKKLNKSHVPYFDLSPHTRKSTLMSVS